MKDILAEFQRMADRAENRATVERIAYMLEEQKRQAMFALCAYMGFSSGVRWLGGFEYVHLSDTAPFG